MRGACLGVWVDVRKAKAERGREDVRRGNENETKSSGALEKK